MTNGFGAGFLTLGLLAALAGVAGLLVAVAVAAALLRRRRKRVPGLVRPLAAGLLIPVLGIAAFGVVALADEAAIGAAALVASVFGPLAAGAFRTRRSTSGWITRLASVTLSWSGPYVVAVVAFMGTNVVVTRAFDLAPGEARALGVGWLAVGVAGLTATVGARSLVGPMAELLGGS